MILGMCQQHPRQIQRQSTHKDKYKDKDRRELLRKSHHLYALLISYILYIAGKLRTLSIIL